jgi:TrmH family RNA methyltransferase
MQSYKKDGDLSYAPGTELTLELLKKHPSAVTAVYVQKKQKDTEAYRQIIELCERYHIGRIETAKPFTAGGAKENCYIMGQFRKYSQPIRPERSHVVLVHPGNMGNLGTIIRSAAAFGVPDLAIIAPGADIYDPKVIRATMRAFFSLHFSYFDSFEAYASAVTPRPMFPFMLDGAVKLKDVAVPKTYSLIFGNEATGLDESYKKAGTPVFIEQLDTVDSLNLDNAVSIALYEFTHR